ncbi:MAG TPA: phosphoglycerate kinase [Candidatus Thermoplasmatota archaeon]|nr:phosphoglycerate kinase [Candidatus Thermoplasmatota archaeon]
MPEEKPYFTVDDLKVKDKTILLRVDINAPIVDGRIEGKDRIQAAAATVDQLASQGAKVVILAHQGRKGDADFTSLREHAEVLDTFTACKVSFVGTPDKAPVEEYGEYIGGRAALARIKDLPAGHALMLENVRALDDETKKGKPHDHAQAPFVKALAAVSQGFVNDAFSAAHRAQASLVGFTELLPSAAGLTMDRELTALARSVDAPEPPAVYFLGGSKPEDSIAVMRANFTKGTLDTALLGGLVANLFLVARGHEIGKPSRELLEKKGILQLLPEAEKLLEEFDAQIVTPVDVVVKDGHGVPQTLWVEDMPVNHPIVDIGAETIAMYVEEINAAGSLMMNGPAGLYEEPPYDKGTRAVLNAFAHSDAFSLLGGGHTITAIGEFGLKFEQFGYVSLAGGALMAYLTGEALPAVEALKSNKAKFSHKP